MNLLLKKSTFLSKRFLSGVLLWSLFSSVNAQIIVTEVYPNPCGQEGVNGANEGREWFELTNTGTFSFSLDGFTIADNTTNSTTTNRFRISTLSIGAGATMVFSGLPLATFNSIFSTSIAAANYFEIPATPIWSTTGGASGMSNSGWMNNGAGDNIRIFTDSAATVELTGSYRPTTSFPGTSNGQSFYWDGVSSDWILNSNGGSPSGFEASDPGCPYFANPGESGGAMVPEPGAVFLVFSAGLLLLGHRSSRAGPNKLRRMPV